MADDHPVVRQGLKETIDEAQDMTTIGEAADACETLKAVRSHQPDVLVMDLNMPGRAGLDLVKRLRAEHPNLAILVLSICQEELYALRVLQAGADGYLDKMAAIDAVTTALRTVAAGGKYVSERVAEQLALGLAGRTEPPPHEALSDREFQVLVNLGHGKPVRQIAQELFLSESTVRGHRARLQEKLGVTSPTGLTRYALAKGLAVE